MGTQQRAKVTLYPVGSYKTRPWDGQGRLKELPPILCWHCGRVIAREVSFPLSGLAVGGSVLVQCMRGDCLKFNVIYYEYEMEEEQSGANGN